MCFGKRHEGRARARFSFRVRKFLYQDTDAAAVLDAARADAVTAAPSAFVLASFFVAFMGKTAAEAAEAGAPAAAQAASVYE